MVAKFRVAGLVALVWWEEEGEVWAWMEEGGLSRWSGRVSRRGDEGMREDGGKGEGGRREVQVVSKTREEDGRRK